MNNPFAPKYPPVAYHFMVQILGPHGPADFAFQEISGFKATIDTEAVAEGGENRFQHQLPTKKSYTPLVLKRGVALLGSLLNTWCTTSMLAGIDTPIAMFNVLVFLLDENKIPIMTWTFINAYPTSFETSSLDAQKGEILFETITLNYQYFIKI